MLNRTELLGAIARCGQYRFELSMVFRFDLLRESKMSRVERSLYC